MSFEKASPSDAEAHSQEQMKERVLNELRDMLKAFYAESPNPKTFDLLEGEKKERAVRTHAYIEGYIGALLGANMITTDELDKMMEEAKSSASS